MATVYMFRHQHHGIMSSHVFAKPPTEQQIAPLRAECERLHGREGWELIHEAEFLTDGVPSFPDREQAPGLEVVPASFSGVGTVTTSDKAE